MMIKWLLSAGVALALSAPGLALSQTPPNTTASDPARFQVGRFVVIALSDGMIPLDVHPLLKGISTAEMDDLLRDAGKSNPVPVSINAFLVDTGSRQILIDVGAGELFGTSAGKLPQSLAAAGYLADDIDDILLTHIHADHSGGLVIGGRRLFPNAMVHVGRADVALFLDRENDPGLEDFLFEQARRTLGPYLEAGKLKPFSGETRLFPGITAVPTPGHTPGHAFYRIESAGETIEFWGDIVHIGAIQVERPAVTITYDTDQAASRRQRQAQFARAARNRRLLAAPHLDFPGVGQLQRRGTGYDWIPAQMDADASTSRRR